MRRGWGWGGGQTGVRSREGQARARRAVLARSPGPLQREDNNRRWQHAGGPAGKGQAGGATQRATSQVQRRCPSAPAVPAVLTAGHAQHIALDDEVGVLNLASVEGEGRGRVRGGRGITAYRPPLPHTAAAAAISVRWSADTAAPTWGLMASSPSTVSS